MRAAIAGEIGCQIETAGSAEEAIALVDRNVFDAVLIDRELGSADPLRLGSRVRFKTFALRHARPVRDVVDVSTATEANAFSIQDADVDTR